MITHDYYDHSDAERDINIVFPIERLWELEMEGIIGGVIRIHYGFMGHILGRHLNTLINKSVPEVARRLRSDKVDLVLLTPGCGLCTQSVGLIQREIEKRGIPTIGISLVGSVSEKIKPPRTVFLPFPFGHPLGVPNNASQQRSVLTATLDALYDIEKPGSIISLPYRWRGDRHI
jgi:D-proline reductase (dithiol) PrdB